jgi:hypothetical protein
MREVAITFLADCRVLANNQRRRLCGGKITNRIAVA